MKKNIYVLVLLIFNQINLNAQDAINVKITGTLEPFGGIYNYNGIENGKNKYSKESIVDNEIYITNIVLRVNTNVGSAWVLEDNKPDTGGDKEVGFYNLNVPDGLLPPTEGWIISLDPDLSGTMTIEINNLALNDINKPKNSFLPYPNPAINDITIKNTINPTETFRYEIIDMSGRQVKSGEAVFNEKLNVEDMKTGNHILQIIGKNGNISYQNLINKL